jgi:hypothetical protein
MGLFIPRVVAAQSCDDISFTAPTLDAIESCVQTKHTVRLLKEGRIAVCPLSATSLAFNACMKRYDAAITEIASRVVAPQPTMSITPVSNKNSFVAVLWILLCIWGFFFTSKKERMESLPCAVVIEGTFARLLSDEEYMDIVGGDMSSLRGMSMYHADNDCSEATIGECFYVNDSPNTYSVMGERRRTMNIRMRIR